MTARYAGPTSFGDYPSTYHSSYSDDRAAYMKPTSNLGIVDTTAMKAYHTLTWAMDSVSDTATRASQPIVSIAKTYGGVVYDTVRLYLNQYPLARAFLYAFALFSSIPVAVFLGFAAISATICLSIATIGIAVVEGSILAFGLLCLSPFLFFSFWGTVFVVGAYYTIYYGLQFATTGIQATQNVTGLQRGTGIVGTATDIVKDTVATGAGLMRAGETLIVGGSH